MGVSARNHLSTIDFPNRMEVLFCEFCNHVEHLQQFQSVAMLHFFTVFIAIVKMAPEVS